MSALAGIKIDKERRRLQRASAVLACLVIAANEDNPEEIDCSDVAWVVRELVDAAVAALDSVELGARRAMSTRGVRVASESIAVSGARRFIAVRGVESRSAADGEQLRSIPA